MRTLSRTLITFSSTIVIGGIAVGACLAALIPGTVEIATAHHYTAKQVGELQALAAAVDHLLDRRRQEMGDPRPRGARPDHRRSTRCPKIVQSTR